MTLQTGDVRVLFLLLDDALGPVMLLLTDPIPPYQVRIVALHGQDGDVTTLLKDGDAGYTWIEDVVDDLGIGVIADITLSLPAPNLDGIEFEGLDGWASAAFGTVLESTKLLLP